MKTRLMAADRAAIDLAARYLEGGGLVALPTETVYGLAADATNAKAVARLYAAKDRPAFNPLISHIADAAAARRLGAFNAEAEQLAAGLWPGPLTLVLRKTPDCPVSDLSTAGLDTIALRVPDHPVARAIIAASGRPLVAPSANRSGHVSPTTAAHVMADLDSLIDLVVDGGPAPIGVESTIVGLFGDAPVLLRPGGVPRSKIEHALGHPLADPLSNSGAVLAPGGLPSHYAPRAQVRLDADDVKPGEALLAFGPLPRWARAAAICLNLSERGDLIEAAANLFSHLRALDRVGVATIAVMHVPTEGLGEAINDRLRRAAAPRPDRT